MAINDIDSGQENLLSGSLSTGEISYFSEENTGDLRLQHLFNIKKVIAEKTFSGEPLDGEYQFILMLIRQELQVKYYSDQLIIETTQSDDTTFN